MKTFRPFFATTVLVVFPAIAALAVEEKTAPTLLIDFTTSHMTREGAWAKNVGYMFGDWQGKVVEIPNKGALVNALPGKGGMGANKLLDFRKGEFAELVFIIGNRNQAETINFSLVNYDGTDQFWSIPLRSRAKGVTITFRMPLNEPTKVDKPGKIPGFDKNKVKSWQIKGDYQAPVVEILVLKLNSAN